MKKAACERRLCNLFGDLFFTGFGFRCQLFAGSNISFNSSGCFFRQSYAAGAGNAAAFAAHHFKHVIIAAFCGVSF